MEIKDGERLPLAVKDMGSCEVFPHALVHSPNGRSAVYVTLTITPIVSCADKSKVFNA